MIWFAKCFQGNCDKCNYLAMQHFFPNENLEVTATQLHSCLSAVIAAVVIVVVTIFDFATIIFFALRKHY